MAVKSKEELLAAIKGKIGESTDDETLSFMEDVQDTLSSMESAGNEDWHKKYTENDEAWRKRYKERFFSSVTEDDKKDGFGVSDKEDEHKPLTFEALFKEN